MLHTMAVIEQLIYYGWYIFIGLLLPAVLFKLDFRLRRPETKRYEYIPLSSPTSIRVLSLESGSGDKLYGSLRVVSIDDKVPYDAVSYV
ncbi:hypothetical protein F5Y06DRAFT_18967 [Hypoxylon sp. FL0890]|nr:hypothetical protein F5Y06DRAFT_18967 [Hypoxylon sp. FL0890]